MVCPFCASTETDVYNTRRSAKGNSTWRRRRCLSCHHSFTTYELIDPGSVLRLYSQKKTVPYLRAKVTSSLMKVLDHRADLGQAVEYLTTNIEQKLYKFMATEGAKALPKDMLITTIAESLRQFDPVAYVKYASLYQQLDARNISKAMRQQAN